MTNYEHLNNAPLREAVIDLQFTLEDSHIEDLKTLAEELEGDHGNISPIFVNKISISHDAENNSAATGHEQTLCGYAIQSDSYVCQLMLDRFTISKLAPYNSWEEFKADAKVVWDKYRAFITVKKFKRIAVRYINCIPLPLEDNQLELEDYLQTPPAMPDNINATMGGFFSRLLMLFAEEQCKAVLIQASENFHPDGQAVDVIIDIDIFKDDVAEFNEANVWAYLDKLRTVKNKIFFNTITQKTKEMLK